MLDLNTDKTNDKAARTRYLALGDTSVAGSHFNASSVDFDCGSKRAQKGSQRVARPSWVQYFENGMVLIERDNESPEFISRELFKLKYLAEVN